MALIRSNRARAVVWSCWVVGGFLLLSLGNELVYFALVAGSALLVALVPGALPQHRRRRDNRDLLAIGVLYVAVVALDRLAFVVFTVDNVVGLFLAFASALVLGVAGPVVYTGWLRGRCLRELGLRRDNLLTTAVLALLFAAVQFALTLWGYGLPAPVDWVPLLCMSLVVGVFESVFFRGFVQNSLERQFGTPVGVAAAAALYGAYHVGYGMSGSGLLFLTGLGVVYAVAFAIARNLLVLWPLLTPLGSFYANLQAGDIELPWAAIAGFADVLGLMALAWWLTVRHQRLTPRTGSPSPAR
jgi:membrane protease YdiL (CAAX protease family)